MNNTKTKNNTDSKRRFFWCEVAVLLILLTIGVGSRFWMLDLPNFKPVAALALFAGFFFRRIWVAIFSVLIMMWIANIQLGGMHWQVGLAVYASMLIPVFLGAYIRKSRSVGTDLFSSRRIDTARGWRFFTAAIAMSIAFFVLTNYAVWQFAGWYPLTLAGFVDCYIAAIPFFRATLTGNLIFTTVIVAGYSLACRLVQQRSTCPLDTENATS